MVYATETTTPTAKITISNSATFSDLSAGANGGGFYIDSTNFDIFMNVAVTITNSDALGGAGGVFYYKRGNDLQIKNGDFKYLTSTTSGSFLYSVATNLVYTMQSTTVDCIGSAWSSLSSTLGANSHDIGGAVYIDGATTATVFTSNTIKNCYSGDKGGAYSLIDTTLTDSGGTYSYNGALQGGAIYCDTCTLTLSTISLSYN